MKTNCEEKIVIKKLTVPVKMGRCNIKMQLRYPNFENRDTLSRFYSSMNELFMNGVCKILTENNSQKENEISNDTVTRRSPKKNGLRRERISKNKTERLRCNIYNLDVTSTFDIKKSDEKIISLYIDYAITSGKLILLYKRVAQTWILDEDSDINEGNGENHILLDTEFIKDYYPKSRKANADYDGFYIEETQSGDMIRYFKMLPVPEKACRVKRRDYPENFIKFV